MIQSMDAKTARTHNARLFSEKFGGPKGFSDALKGKWTPTQVSQWISLTKPKGIGHALARKLEIALNLAEGAFDHPVNRSANREQAPAKNGRDDSEISNAPSHLGLSAGARQLVELIREADTSQSVSSDSWKLLAGIVRTMMQTTGPAAPVPKNFRR